MVVIDMIPAHCGGFIACIIIKIDHHGTIKQINFSLFSLKMTNLLRDFFWRMADTKALIFECQERMLQTHHAGT